MFGILIVSASDSIKKCARKLRTHKEVKGMVFVVERMTQKIVNRCDAWELGAVERMTDWAFKSGYTTVIKKITLSGDMVIWVE